MHPTTAPIDRIRLEYREMPGLRLTFAQACRLWQLDESSCREALLALEREQVLRRMRDGSFIALPRPRQPWPAHAIPVSSRIAAR
jgi:hypothetical protein